MKNYFVLDTKAAIMKRIRGALEKDNEVRRFWEKAEVEMVFNDDDRRLLLVNLLILPGFSNRLVKEIKNLLGTDANKCQIDIWSIERKRFFPTLKQRCFSAKTRRAIVSKIRSGNLEVILAKVSNEKIAMSINWK